ncbi:MAG: shikimate kinase [Oscillospiraceae bacterium]|jgi:shikimate kinase|nr:shikimate kinase [Oscillospiraceae bacterium]
MNNLILIGMPASGKSTIGVVLAKTLGMDFTDTDLIIQKREGKLLQQIIDEEGLKKFLKAEQDAILSIEAENTVIATGGSAVLSDKAMRRLKDFGKIIYLYADCKILEKRLYNIETRGIAKEKNESVIEIFDKRKDLYKKYADITIEAGNFSVEQIVKIILKNI